MMTNKHMCKAYIIVNLLVSNKKQLIKIWHSFNIWQYPFKRFGSYYNSLPNHNSDGETKYNQFRFISNYIYKRTSEYERLYYHNVEHRKVMTPGEYFTWFYTDHQLPLSQKHIDLLNKIDHDTNRN